LIRFKSRGQLAAEPGAQRGGALPDRLQAQLEGLPDGGAQAQDVDVAVPNWLSCDWLLAWAKRLCRADSRSSA